MDAAKVMWLLKIQKYVFDDIKRNSWMSENVHSNSLN